jgi:hypothetical protein
MNTRSSATFLLKRCTPARRRLQARVLGAAAAAGACARRGGCDVGAHRARQQGDTVKRVVKAADVRGVLGKNPQDLLKTTKQQ